MPPGLRPALTTSCNPPAVRSPEYPEQSRPRRPRDEALGRHWPAASEDCGGRAYRRRLTSAPHPHVRSHRSEEHTSELQPLMRISYAVFCLKKTTKHINLNPCIP